MLAASAKARAPLYACPTGERMTNDRFGLFHRKGESSTTPICSSGGCFDMEESRSACEHCEQGKVHEPVPSYVNLDVTLVRNRFALSIVTAGFLRSLDPTSQTFRLLLKAKLQRHENTHVSLPAAAAPLLCGTVRALNPKVPVNGTERKPYFRHILTYPTSSTTYYSVYQTVCSRPPTTLVAVTVRSLLIVQCHALVSALRAILFHTCSADGSFDPE